MADDGWGTMLFDQAVQVNPTVRLERGSIYPFVDMQAVDPGSRSVSPSESREFKGGGSRFMNGDTLMARITPCLENGKIARYAAPKGKDVGHGSTEFIVIRGRPNVTDNGFAYYLTKWDGVRQYCISQMTGSSGRQRVPTSALSHREVTIPPLKEQQAIACILGTLDDKIELNRRMSETLEAMARALFKSWFVDFDPVRAKMEGRWRRGQSLPGLPAHLYDLFPDRLVDSEQGKIPEGWEVGAIGDLCEIAIGGDWGKDQKFKGADEVLCLRGVDLAHLREIGYANPPRRWVKPNSVVQRKLDERDVLVAVSGIGPVGRSLWACDKLESLWGFPVIYSNFCKRLRCKTPAAAIFIDRRLHMLHENGEIWDYVTGTSVPNLDLSGLLKTSQLVIPPDLLIEQYYYFVRLITYRLYSKESRTLAQIRDTLLPKLISGELRVKDAERFLKEAKLC